MSTSYPVQPPAYAPAAPKGYSAIPQAEPSVADLPPRTEGDAESDDFKYGVTVDQCDNEIRMQFLKKVYSVLFLQIMGTTAVGAAMSRESVSLWVRENQWAFIVPLLGSLVTMGLLFWKRHSHPLNLGLLSLFTLFEAVSLGAVVSYVNQAVVLQALVITLFVFAGLTLFTFQTKYDFSGMGSWLFSGLLLLVGLGFVQIFIPFSQTFDLVLAGAGCLIFSAYIVYDTYMITRRLSPDEWVLAVISLYLDVVNLFLNILRLLNGSRDD
ncbi:unnamed protein product [Parajaminaea phylloscopi]